MVMAMLETPAAPMPMLPGHAFFVGLDLGQTHDPTAVAVLERATTLTGAIDPVTFARASRTTLDVRHLERLPLGTPYPEVVRQVLARVTALQGHGRTTVVVDATGVGAPVLDLLREEFRAAGLGGCPIAPVVITGGAQASRTGKAWHVPKRDLVQGLQLALEQRELGIDGRLPACAALLRELTTFRFRTTAAGADQFGVWREGEQDDLVLAAALAVWQARQAPRGASGPLF